MFKLMGFIAFWITVGMFLVLFVEHKIMGFFLIILFLLLAYSLLRK